MILQEHLLIFHLEIRVNILILKDKMHKIKILQILPTIR